MKKLCLMMMGMMFMLASCGELADVSIAISEDPLGPLVASAIVYEQTIDTLVVLRREGAFSKQEIVAITEILIHLDRVFDEWYKAIETNTIELDYKEVVDKSLDQLRKAIKIVTSRSTT